MRAQVHSQEEGQLDVAGHSPLLSANSWETNRDVELGSSHQMNLDFAGHIAVSSAESLLLDLKGLWRKDHNLVKLA